MTPDIARLIYVLRALGQIQRAQRCADRCRTPNAASYRRQARRWLAAAFDEQSLRRAILSFKKHDRRRRRTVYERQLKELTP